MTGPKGYLSFSLFTEIIDEIAERENIALVPFFRGESLLHPRCIDMLAYAKENGVGPIQFATNGTLMTENIARDLIDIEVDFVSFSVDSIDPKDYRQIRKGADLKTVLKNIEFLCNLKKTRGISKPDIQVSVVKTKNTYNGIEDFVNFWQQRVDRVRVYEEHSKDGNFGSLDKAGDDDAVCEKRRPCLKPFTDMVIYWNGCVVLCNHDWDKKYVIGDVNQSAISEIWHNETYRKIREAHLGNGELDEVCKECDHWRTYYRKESLIGEVYVGNSEVYTNA